MNVGCSIKVGLARPKGPNSHKELAKALKISVGRSIALAGSKYANGRRIEQLATVFEAKDSEFIEWGE